MRREKVKSLDHIQEWATRAFDAGATTKEIHGVIEDARAVHERGKLLQKERDKLAAKLGDRDVNL